MKKGHTFMPVSMQELRSIVLDTIAAAGRPAEGEVSPPSTVSFSEFSSERFQESTDDHLPRQAQDERSDNKKFKIKSAPFFPCAGVLCPLLALCGAGQL